MPNVVLLILGGIYLFGAFWLYDGIKRSLIRRGQLTRTNTAGAVIAAVGWPIFLPIACFRRRHGNR